MSVFRLSGCFSSRLVKCSALNDYSLTASLCLMCMLADDVLAFCWQNMRQRNGCCHLACPLYLSSIRIQVIPGLFLSVCLCLSACSSFSLLRWPPPPSPLHSISCEDSLLSPPLSTITPPPHTQTQIESLVMTSFVSLLYHYQENTCISAAELPVDIPARVS